MIPVKQTILHDPVNGQFGNCVSATLASLLHLPISEIPVFTGEDTQEQNIKINQFLKPYGLAIVTIKALDDYCHSSNIHGLYCGVAGESPRFAGTGHMCVGLDGAVEFDPHPDGTGLQKVDTLDLIVCLRPWEFIKREPVEPSEDLPF